MLATLVIASAFTLACSRPAPLAADLVITRANIWTGNPRQPEAQALAILGDRIVEVGGAGEIDRWRGPNTTIVDAEGRRLLPGFNDAHVHFMDGGAQLDNVDLKDADTQAEFARRIGERAKAKPGEWVVGGDWDDQRWTPAQLPTRELIDDATILDVGDPGARVLAVVGTATFYLASLGHNASCERQLHVVMGKVAAQAWPASGTFQPQSAPNKRMFLRIRRMSCKAPAA